MIKTMKTIHPLKIFIATAAVGCAVVAGNLAHAATITWTKTSGGNWSPRQVPTSPDDGLITNAGIHAGTPDVSGVVTNLTFSS